MKVTHLSTRDISGGAARATQRLHQGLLRIGVKSTMFVRKKRSEKESVVQFRPSYSPFARLRRVWRYAYLRSDFFPRYVSSPGDTGPLSDDRTRFAGEVTEQVPHGDIFHLHWVAGFADISEFFERTESPLVWTLHDMNPFTGGCHYSLGCRHFEQACGKCPLLQSKRENDPSRQGWKRKRAVFRRKIERDQLSVVATSQWLTDQAANSTLLGNAPIYRIPYGLDHTLFRPQEYDEKRKELGIEEGAKVILFVADSISNPVKGFEYMRSALKKIKTDHEVVLVSIGKGKPSMNSNLQHIHAGYIEDDQRLSKLYSMADIFVIPSLQEAFGQTALEAMSCGTPVVGFETGGIPDMVRPGETGWLAEPGNVRSLRNAIETALSDQTDRKRKARRCREVVEEEYTLERQAEEYKSLYKSILDTV